jgi:hypothetical protein
MINSETLFKYPKTLEDIEVWKNYDSYKPYHIDIEGLIWYETLQNGIDYLTTLKDEYFKWLKSNHNDEIVEEVNDIIYKSYDIEIFKDKIGYCIFLNAPSFDKLYDTYLWFDGVIKQLNKIKE